MVCNDSLSECAGCHGSEGKGETEAYFIAKAARERENSFGKSKRSARSPQLLQHSHAHFAVAPWDASRKGASDSDRRAWNATSTESGQ